MPTDIKAVRGVFSRRIHKKNVYLSYRAAFFAYSSIFSNVRLTSFKFFNQLFTLKNDCLPLQFKLTKFVSFPKHLSSIYVLPNYQEVLSSFYEAVL